MAKKTSKVPTRIATFGARAPITDAASVNAQYLAARVYRTELAVLENHRRDEVDKILLQHAPYAEIMAQSKALEDALIVVRDRVKVDQAASRTKNVSDIDKQQIKTIKASQTLVWDECKILRSAASKAYAVELVLLQNADNQKTGKDLYHAAKVGDLRSGPYCTEIDRQHRLQAILQQDIFYVQAHETFMATLLAVKSLKKKSLEKDAALMAVKVAKAGLLLAKKAAKKTYAADITVLDAERLTEQELARNVPRLHPAPLLASPFWGTKSLLMESANAAKRIADRPRIRSWDGSGRIGVHLSGAYQGIASILDGTNPFLRIDPVPADAYVTSQGAAREKGQGRKVRQRTTVHLCIGEGAHGQREWASFPVLLHRQLPADAKIKNAWIKRTRIGTELKYHLQMAMESATYYKVTDESLPVVAFDLGWRQKAQERRRILYWYDDTGAHGEVLLPVAHRKCTKNMGKGKAPQVSDIQNYGLSGGLALAEDLRSIRDKRFNVAREAFVGWMAAQQNLPEWFLKAFNAIAQWRSPNRFEQTIRGWYDKAECKMWKWADHRIPGDTQIFDTLVAWGKKNRHLYQWEINETRQSLDRRKDFFRKLSHDFSKRYRMGVLEKFDLSKIAKLAPPEEQNELHETARHNRHETALSEFRNILKTAMPTAEVPAYHTTTKCHKCGHVEKFDAKAELVHKCPNVECGVVWDQDFNAAVNLLVAYHSGETINDDLAQKEAELLLLTEENA